MRESVTDGRGKRELRSVFTQKPYEHPPSPRRMFVPDGPAALYLLRRTADED